LFKHSEIVHGSHWPDYWDYRRYSLWQLRLDLVLRIQT